MEFFEEIGRNIVKLGEVTVQKTKEVAEFTKANAKILELQNKLEKAYAAVGKKYVEEHPANEEEALHALVEKVYALEDRIKELRKQLQNLKGTAVCQECGATCSSEAVFCSKCGAELNKESVVVDADATDAEDCFEEMWEMDFKEVEPTEEVKEVEETEEAEATEESVPEAEV